VQVLAQAQFLVRFVWKKLLERLCVLCDALKKLCAHSKKFLAPPLPGEVVLHVFWSNKHESPWNIDDISFMDSQNKKLHFTNSIDK
jgi:hypothetical protein